MDRNEEMQRLIREYREVPVPDSVREGLQEAIERGKKRAAKRRRVVYLRTAVSCSAAALLILILFGAAAVRRSRSGNEEGISEGAESSPAEIQQKADMTAARDAGAYDAGGYGGFTAGEEAPPAEAVAGLEAQFLEDDTVGLPAEKEEQTAQGEAAAAGGAVSEEDVAEDGEIMSRQDPGRELAASERGCSGEEYTQMLLESFEQEMLQEGGCLELNGYEVLTDSDEWFTLVIYARETDGDGHELRRYYNIDRQSGEVVTLAALCGGSDSERMETISGEIRRQMNRAMEENPAVSDMAGEAGNTEGLLRLRDDQNYYFNGDGDLVIVFDEYEIAPELNGCPEFVIGRELLE